MQPRWKQFGPRLLRLLGFVNRRKFAFLHSSWEVIKARKTGTTHTVLDYVVYRLFYGLAMSGVVVYLLTQSNPKVYLQYFETWVMFGHFLYAFVFLRQVLAHNHHRKVLGRRQKMPEQLIITDEIERNGHRIYISKRVSILPTRNLSAYEQFIWFLFNICSTLSLLVFISSERRMNLTPRKKKEVKLKRLMSEDIGFFLICVDLIANTIPMQYSHVVYPLTFTGIYFLAEYVYDLYFSTRTYEIRLWTYPSCLKILGAVIICHGVIVLLSHLRDFIISFLDKSRNQSTQQRLRTQKRLARRKIMHEVRDQDGKLLRIILEHGTPSQEDVVYSKNPFEIDDGLGIDWAGGDSDMDVGVNNNFALTEVIPIAEVTSVRPSLRYIPQQKRSSSGSDVQLVSSDHLEGLPMLPDVPVTAPPVPVHPSLFTLPDVAQIHHWHPERTLPVVPVPPSPFTIPAERAPPSLFTLRDVAPVHHWHPIHLVRPPAQELPHKQDEETAIEVQVEVVPEVHRDSLNQGKAPKVPYLKTREKARSPPTPPKYKRGPRGSARLSGNHQPKLTLQDLDNRGEGVEGLEMESPLIKALQKEYRPNIQASSRGRPKSIDLKEPEQETLEDPELLHEHRQYKRHHHQHQIDRQNQVNDKNDHRVRPPDLPIQIHQHQPVEKAVYKKPEVPQGILKNQTVHPHRKSYRKSKEVEEVRRPEKFVHKRVERLKERKSIDPVYDPMVVPNIPNATTTFHYLDAKLDRRGEEVPPDQLPMYHSHPGDQIQHTGPEKKGRKSSKYQKGIITGIPKPPRPSRKKSVNEEEEESVVAFHPIIQYFNVPHGEET